MYYLDLFSFPGYLSIGIASVERPSGANYLLKTKQSLIDNMSEEDEENAIIVIFLADHNIVLVTLSILLSQGTLKIFLIHLMLLMYQYLTTGL